MPSIEIEVDDPKRFENGYRYLFKKFAELEADLERMRGMIYDLERNKLDNGTGIR
jgi:hypothetical protein